MGKFPVLKEIDLWLWMEVLMHRAIREKRKGLSQVEVYIAIKIGNCKRVRGKRIRGKRVRGKRKRGKRKREFSFLRLCVSARKITLFCFRRFASASEGGVRERSSIFKRKYIFQLELKFVYLSC